MFDFNDKIVVVTGGEKGIGKAITAIFAKRGAEVVIIGIDEETGKRTAEEIEGEVSFIKTDVSSQSQVSKLPARIENMYGLTDILVNNAGLHMAGNIENTGFQEWKKIINVNLNGVFLMTKYILRHMKRKGKGTIVNIASEAGIDAFADQIVYNVSKAAVIQFTKSMAVDYAGENIRANAVCPGTTMTPLVQKALENAEDPAKLRKTLEGIRPLNRLGKTEEIAKAVLCLASDELSYATGSVFTIDGGKTAQ